MRPILEPISFIIIYPIFFMWQITFIISENTKLGEMSMPLVFALVLVDIGFISK